MCNILNRKSILIKLAICCVGAIIATMIWNSPAFACSGIYVGAEASTDGTSMIARSNDLHPVNEPCYIRVYGGTDGEKLTKILSDNGFEWDLEHDCYRFITIPNCEVVDNCAFITSAINEYGVSISATLTGYCCKEAIAANPYVEGGIVEDMMPAVVGSSCKNAREGIELIARIIDEKGSGEDNIIMISDQRECWYMEIYGGHQYCAVKAPEDCVCALGNEFMLDTVDETSNDTICSKELFTLPQQHGFAVYDANGKMNLHDTYSGKGNFTDYSHLRTWEGHRILSPSTIGDYNPKQKYPLFYKPDNKVSLETVMNYFRDRYEGTPYALGDDKHDYRPIATESQIRTHILQTYRNVPEDMACCEWLAMSNAEFSTYVPISNLQTAFDDTYTCNIDSYDNDVDNAYCRFKSVNGLAGQNRDKYGKVVKEYWAKYEKYHRTHFPKVLNKAAEDAQSAKGLIDSYCSAAQSQASYDAKRLVNDLIFYMNCTEETFNKRLNSLKTGDLSYADQKYSKVQLCYDLELLGRIYGWKIENACIQPHNPDMPDYNYDKIGDPEQADNGGEEGYLRMTKDGHTIEVHTNNGHLTSKAKCYADGEQYPGYAYLEDGKVFGNILCFDKIMSLGGDQDTSSLNKEIASPNRSIDGPHNFWEALIYWPYWANILSYVWVGLCVASVVILISIFVFVRKSNKNK